MRRKQQIQALQQELALLRQTVDSGKELAALAADAAGQLRRPGLRTVAVQVMRSPRVRRAALIAAGSLEDSRRAYFSIKAFVDITPILYAVCRCLSSVVRQNRG